MFCNIINIIKINILNKKNKIIIKKNKINNRIIKILIKLNIIKYVIKKNENIIIYLNFFKKNKSIFKLKNMFKKTNVKIIKFKNLIKINKKNNILLLSTNKGLLTNYDAIKKKTGGILILHIWN